MRRRHGSSRAERFRRPLGGHDRRTSIHAFQRNGITANEGGTDVRIRRNLVTGLGPTTGAVQNGIQVARGATGVVEENVVTETISANCTAVSCLANASNILLGSGSTGVRVTRNVLGRAQTGVAVFGHGNRVQENVIFTRSSSTASTSRATTMTSTATTSPAATSPASSRSAAGTASASIALTKRRSGS